MAWADADGRGVAALPAIQREKFYRLCPEFLIELRSAHDRIRKLRAKMEEHMANGAHLAGLIDPFENTVTVYRPGLPPELLNGPAAVWAKAPWRGSSSDMSKIRE